MNDRSIDINTHGAYVQGVDDIKQTWGIILNTVKGSDPLRPTFGCGVFDYIDKPVSVFASEFASQVITDLERWEQRATIKKVGYSITPSGRIFITISGIYTPTSDIITTAISLSSLVVIEGTVKTAYGISYNENAYK